MSHVTCDFLDNQEYCHKVWYYSIYSTKCFYHGTGLNFLLKAPVAVKGECVVLGNWHTKHWVLARAGGTRKEASCTVAPR